MVASFAMASSLMIVDRLIPSGGTLSCALSVKGVNGLQPNPTGGNSSEDVLPTSFAFREWSPLTTYSEKQDVQYRQ